MSRLVLSLVIAASIWVAVVALAVTAAVLNLRRQRRLR